MTRQTSTFACLALAGLLGSAAQAQDAIASLLDLPDGTHHLGGIDPEKAGHSVLMDKAGAQVRGVEYDRTGNWFACFDVALGADGMSGVGDVATTGKDGVIEPRPDATARFDVAGPLRALDPALAAERLADGEVEAFRDRCLAAIDGG